MISTSLSTFESTRSYAVPGFFVQAVLSALQAERVDLSGLRVPLRAALAQTDPAGLALPWTSFLELLHSSCLATGNPALGLLIGQRITETNLHMLGPIIVASQSLRCAIEHIDAVQTVLFGDAHWQLSEHGELAFFTTKRPSETYRPETDLALALAFTCAQRFVGPAHREQLFVHVAGTPRAHAEIYRRVFEQRVVFDATHTGLCMPRGLLDVARPGTDPALAATLRQMALDRFMNSAQTGSWTARIEGALREHTQLVHVDFDQIAARWQLNARALRRRVEAEGTRLIDLLNRVRLERARQQLQQSSAPMADIAEALGYSDVSAFARAFKRLAGVSPAQYREQATKG
jgi:AraC-like DNA-binding protein